ncbi:hypothetical protein LTR27_001916 [Elasticomyces elasticus]|nr:hypothetical protein LTR27_001916 [Elasticomyces elasticus]
MSDVFDIDQLDRHLTRANANHEVVELFTSFLLDISTADGSEDLSTYQIPHGSLGSRIAHFLHWPPESVGRPRSWSSFNFESYTLRILTAIFPNAKASALFHDYYFKRVLINHPNGNRKTNRELYGGDDKIELLNRFSKTLFEESDADVIVVWGGKPRESFKEWFPHEWEESTTGEDQYGIYHDVQVGDKKRSVVFLPHPEHIGRWASKPVLSLVSQIVETIYVALGEPIDLQLLQSRLREKPELEMVVVPRTPKNTLEARRRYRNESSKKYYHKNLPRSREKGRVHKQNEVRRINEGPAALKEAWLERRHQYHEGEYERRQTGNFRTREEMRAGKSLMTNEERAEKEIAKTKNYHKVSHAKLVAEAKEKGVKTKCYTKNCTRLNDDRTCKDCGRYKPTMAERKGKPQARRK